VQAKRRCLQSVTVKPRRRIRGEQGSTAAGVPRSGTSAAAVCPQPHSSANPSTGADRRATSCASVESSVAAMRCNYRTNDLDYLKSFALDNVISAQELVRLGVPECTVYRRCRAGGPWQLLAPGVVLLSNGTPTRRQLLQAALLHAGVSAVITGLDAARAHGLRRGELPAHVHVLIAETRQVRSVRNIVVERRNACRHHRSSAPASPSRRSSAASSTPSDGCGTSRTSRRS
jgi:hypothetical protein